MQDTEISRGRARGSVGGQRLTKAVFFAIFALISLIGEACDRPATGTAGSTGTDSGAANAAESASDTAGSTASKPVIVVTYSILGAIVKELAKDKAEVHVLIPNGLDPHEWEASAKDVELLISAKLVVENGLGFEGGLKKVLSRVRERGVRFFTASDYIKVRYVGPGEGIPGDDADQAEGAPDPHLWTDPSQIAGLLPALSAALETVTGSAEKESARDLGQRLFSLDAEITAQVQKIPIDRRVLITGHESLGYFAQRYGFKLSGAVIPSLSTEAGVSAADISRIAVLVKETGTPVVFTELGTPPKIVQAIARAANVRVVELSTHVLPVDGSYFSYMRQLAGEIAGGLQ